jgi:hypothetical protein
VNHRKEMVLEAVQLSWVRPTVQLRHGTWGFECRKSKIRRTGKIRAFSFDRKVNRRQQV